MEITDLYAKMSQEEFDKIPITETEEFDVMWKKRNSMDTLWFVLWHVEGGQWCFRQVQIIELL